MLKLYFLFIVYRWLMDKCERMCQQRVFTCEVAKCKFVKCQHAKQFIIIHILKQPCSIQVYFGVWLKLTTLERVW